MTLKGAHPWFRRGVLTTALLVMGLLAVRWLPLAAGSRKPSGVREVVLVVRNMGFYVEGEPARNPAMRFTPGERVRIVLRNEEPGVVHNFAIDDWGVRTRELRGKGTARVEFSVPEARGERKYQCTPHAVMMTGVIDVR